MDPRHESSGPPPFGRPMKTAFALTLIFLLLIFHAPLSGATSRTVLLVRETDYPRVLLRMPLPYGDTFTIRYIHSVDHTPVYEVFKAKKGKGLVLVETYFQMFGAGMGHWEGHGQIVQDGPWTKIKDINKPLGSFLLRVGASEVAHTILYNGEEWNLSEKAAGKLVEVMIKSSPDPNGD